VLLFDVSNLYPKTARNLDFFFEIDDFSTKYFVMRDKAHPFFQKIDELYASQEAPSGPICHLKAFLFFEMSIREIFSPMGEPFQRFEQCKDKEAEQDTKDGNAGKYS
jgi:hypothetical protein